jgi:hypothetical protein
MIELDIKIRAKNHDNLKMLIDAMTDSLAVANTMGKVDVQFTAETDGDKMILIRKEIIIPTDHPVKTLIEDFIKESDLSLRSVNVLFGRTFQGNQHINGEKPFKYAEDITQERFLKCTNAGSKSWEEVEAELKRQKIKY